MAVKINKGDVSGGINMTPMIDCVFLLLIFFLVATEFEEDERSIPVKLPQASEAMPLTARPKEITVNVDQQGRFVVSNQELSEQQLLGVLLSAAANNPGRQSVIIRGDKRAPWQSMMTVMNLCNKANIRDYKPATANE